jgi:hypothetical protein
MVGANEYLGNSQSFGAGRGERSGVRAHPLRIRHAGITTYWWIGRPDAILSRQAHQRDSNLEWPCRELNRN